MAPLKIPKKSLDKIISPPVSKVGKPNKITTSFSPNSKKNKADDNTSIVYSAQTHHHWCTFYWIVKLMDANDDGFNWFLPKDIDIEGEFSTFNKIFFMEKRAFGRDEAEVNSSYKYFFVVCICRLIVIVNLFLPMKSN